MHKLDLRTYGRAEDVRIGEIGCRPRKRENMKIERRVLSFLFLLMLSAGGPVRLQASNKAQNKQLNARVAGKTDPSSDAAPVEVDPRRRPGETYEIGDGDVLAVSVWHESEISRQLVVRSDGMISLPLIGDILASGQTPQDLARVIADKLKSYLTDPRVTVIVTEVHSRWFMVLGEVVRPGKFPLTRPTTILEALSETGGFHEFARLSKIYVLHQVDGKTVRLPFHYDKVVKGQKLTENIELSNGDTIVVP